MVYERLKNAGIAPSDYFGWNSTPVKKIRPMPTLKNPFQFFMEESPNTSFEDSMSRWIGLTEQQRRKYYEMWE